MDSRQDALVEAIRAIIGPSDSVISRERILALLEEAGNDPNKAVDLFFQAEASNGSMLKQNDVEGDEMDAEENDVTGDENDEWPKEAAELSDLLGGDVDKQVILDLLRRTNNNLQKAVEIYFAENGADAEFDESSDEEDEKEAPTQNANFPPIERVSITTSPASTILPQTLSEVKPIEAHQLEPLTPPPATSESTIEPPPAPTTAEKEILNAPGTYEVEMINSNFRWQIGAVFGRAVVQWVEPGGPAALAGIHKSDVLLSFRDTIVNEKNCAAIVQQLSQERIVVPSTLRFRRAPEPHPHHSHATTSKPVEANGVATATESQPFKDHNAEEEKIQEPTDQKKEQPHALASLSTAAPPLDFPSSPVVPHDKDGDVVMETTGDEIASKLAKVEPKYGFQMLCHAVDSVVDAIGGDSAELKVIVDLLLMADFSMDRAVNNFLNEDRVVSDFRRVIGYDWDPENPANYMGSAPYRATIPAGPLGLTVENILERTIVVDIKPGGAAERAAVKRSSWLVGLNGVSITRLTHKETLRMIETASRPLELELLVVPQEEYKALRKQLSMNIRQQKTERPIPEQDRMSFRVFQMKIHHAMMTFPKQVVVALFQYLSTEDYHYPLLDISYVKTLDRLFPAAEEWDHVLVQESQQMEEETSGEMCTERRFLLNLFASIHEYDDKGESTVIRTIQFLGWLAMRSAKMQQHIDGKGISKDNRQKTFAQRYAVLLCVIMHVLESLSIIENHATWDVMVNALKMLMGSITDRDVDTLLVPMFARLSISSSPTARIVPVALLSLVYPRVGGDIPVQLRGMLDRMCSDDNPLVRRAVTSVIGELANAAGTTAAPWTVQLLEKATSDSHDIVRIFAVKGCIQLAKNLRRILHKSSKSSKEEVDQSLRLLYVQMVPMVNTYTSDSSWQVRLETARTLPAFCRAFGFEYTDVFVDHFVAMVRDPTVEVRRACAEGAFLLGEALVALAAERNVSIKSVESASNEESADESVIDDKKMDADVTDPPINGKSEYVATAQLKIVRSVLPATYGLSTDVSVAVRLALARSVGKSLQLVGSHNYDDLVPILTQFLDESQDATVRAALLEEMARYCDSSSETIAAMMFPAIKSLMTSAQWRVRVKFVHCVAAWAERTDGATVPVDFATGCLDMLTDSVHDVRAMACSKLPILVKSLGNEWLSEQVIARVSACLQSTFHGRLTGLLALELLASELKQIDKLQEVIETVVEECTSKIANLRFRALRTLALLVPLLNDPVTTESTLEIVRQLARAETEADPDVREAAEATQTRLEALLS